jgi:hypothetical protein
MDRYHREELHIYNYSSLGAVFLTDNEFTVVLSSDYISQKAPY